jgi:metallophosphoesterase superfamily enzyme
VDRQALDKAFTLSGHIHPVMRLRPLRGPGLRVPVFWQRPAGLVLPSFGAFTGGFAVRPTAGEHLFAVGPTAVTQMS